MKTIIKFLIIGFFVGGIFGGYVVKQCSTPQISHTDSIVYVTDTLPVPDYEYELTIEYRDTGNTKVIYKDRIVEVPIPIDTAEMVKDYLIAREYKIDTSALDARFYFKGTVYANRLLSYEIRLENKRESIINKQYKLGVGLMYADKKISPMVSYQTKRFNYIVKYNTYYNTFEGGVIYKFNKK